MAPPGQPSSAYVACADIGGTKALLGLADAGGRLLARDRYLLDAAGHGDPLGGTFRDPEPMARELADRWRALARQAGRPWSECAGIGCSAAIMGDLDRGIIFAAPNMLGTSPRNVPFRDMLQAAADRPAWLEMDAYAAALGEAWQGVGKGVDYFVYVIVGTGIGAGILVRGEVFRGWHGTAGELGHTTVYPHGPACNCGRYGCLEALASGPAIARRAEGAVIQSRETVLRKAYEAGEITPESVFEAARQGDEVAADVVSQTVEYLAIGLSNVVHLLNPRLVALGGGVMRGGADLLLDPLRRAVAARCGPWIDVEGLQIVLAALGEEAALLGAARKVWKAIGVST